MTMLSTYMGPAEFGPGEGTGTPWHPHRGFETVTYLLEGDLEHRDSLGNSGYLRTGDTQWMTAGSGVLHKEGPSAAAQRTGGRTHGLQKMTAPAYQDLRAVENAIEERDGATVRVIAGELFGMTGPGQTRTPTSYAHVTLDEGAVVSTELPRGHVVLAYPLTGGFRIGDTQVDEGNLAVIDGDEPVARYGPFVMNTDDEVRQAFVDFDHGRFGTPTD